MDRDALWNMANELRDVLPLSALSEADGRELVSHMRVRRLEEGDVVYQRHDPAADAFVVHRGLVKSVLHHWDGRELLLGLYGRGQFFGTLALFDPGARRDSTVSATMPTTTLQVPCEDAVRVLLRNPVAMHFMAQRYIRMIQRLQRQVEINLNFDTKSRLALFLIELEHLPQRVHLTQDQLAVAIGVTARTVRALLADFAKLGLIESHGARVLEEAGLRREIRQSMPAEFRDEFFRDFEVLFRDT